MTKCPACGYEYKGQRLASLRDGAQMACKHCGNTWFYWRDGTKPPHDR